MVVNSRGSSRKITHIQFKEWPDKSVPESAENFNLLLDLIHKKQVSSFLACLSVAMTPNFQTKLTQKLRINHKAVPIVVHCAAGIGRTGMMVALSICREHLSESKQINVKEVVKALRQNRAQSVQSETQYIFIVRCMVEYCLKNKIIRGFDWDLFNATKQK